MAKKLRTFLAVHLPADLQESAGSLIRQLKQRIGGVQWTAPENLHLTLRFLGDVDEREIMDVCRIAQRAADTTAPFFLTCAGLGAFPTLRRPRTIWIGTTEGRAQMESLCQLLDGPLAELGFRSEHRPYVPHLTLGRVKSGAQAADFPQILAERQAYQLGVMPVDAITVYSSQLTKDGPTHQILATCPL